MSRVPGVRPPSAEPPEGYESRDAEPPAPHVLPIEDAIDLHPFAPRDVVEVVRSYLEAARERGLLEVRLIHGKGIGTQRARVQSLLTTLPEVAGFRDAPADRGHWGATIVRLKPLLRGRRQVRQG